MKLGLLAASVALFTVSAGTANATIIGTAVTQAGTTIDGGTATNPIDFYIPLSKDASGNYGTGTIGRAADTCTAPSATDPCGGGYLGMLLKFEGVSAGSQLMTLKFTDLDLAGINDPDYFFERLSIFALSSPSFSFVSNNNPLATFTQSNSQTLNLNVGYFGGGNLYFGLLFGSSIFANGTFLNTPETLVASLDRVSVPEPATLSLLGAGLLAMGFVRRKRREV